MQINRKENKNIIVIHNMRSVKTKNELAVAVKRDILDVFESPIEEKDEITGCIYYKSKGFVHFIFAEEGAEAGHMRNDATAAKILNMISNLGLDDMQINDFWPRFENAL